MRLHTTLQTGHSARHPIRSPARSIWSFTTATRHSFHWVKAACLFSDSYFGLRSRPHILALPVINSDSRIILDLTTDFSWSTYWVGRFLLYCKWPDIWVWTGMSADVSRFTDGHESFALNTQKSRPRPVMWTQYLRASPAESRMTSPRIWLSQPTAFQGIPFWFLHWDHSFCRSSAISDRKRWRRCRAKRVDRDPATGPAKRTLIASV